jgi:hypothetical protein
VTLAVFERFWIPKFGVEMNKFLWNLFGIKDDDIPDVSRRGFLKMLGGAAIVGAAAPKYFFAPKVGWNAGNIYTPFLNYGDLNAATIDHIIPALVDNVFKESPVLQRLRGNVSFHGGSRIRNSIYFDRLVNR